MNKKKLLRKFEKSKKMETMDLRITQSGQEYYNYYQSYTEKMFNEYTKATAEQYKNIASQYVSVLFVRKNVKELKGYIVKKRIPDFMDLILDSAAGFDIEFYMTPESTQSGKPLSSLLFKDYKSIIDGYKLEATIRDLLQKKINDITTE